MVGVTPTPQILTEACKVIHLRYFPWRWEVKADVGKAYHLKLLHCAGLTAQTATKLNNDHVGVPAIWPGEHTGVRKQGRTEHR